MKPVTNRSDLLVLVGFMGAGKTTVGRLLANRLQCSFVDLDDEIERIHGPIPKLFEQMGESGFRAIEHHQLDLLLEALPGPAVLALGGGAFVQPSNRERLQSCSATCIFLDADFDTLRDRVSGTGDLRPLARDPERFRVLYAERRTAYELAQHRVNTSTGTPESIAAELEALARSAWRAHRATL